jgi:hypothetical protein
VAESRNERILGIVQRVLEADERVEARGVCWAAVRRPKVPLLVLGRHQYDIVLTDRRVLMFSRRRRRLRPDDVAFAKRYSALTLERGRGIGFPLARHHIATDTGRRLVIEWRPRHRALARRFTAALTAPAAPAAPASPVAG